MPQALRAIRTVHHPQKHTSVVSLELLDSRMAELTKRLTPYALDQ